MNTKTKGTIILALILFIPFITKGQNKMENNIAKNKEVVRTLLVDAMPHGNFDFIKDVVSKDAITQRAGFANLFISQGDAIPPRGNFLEWVEKGWKPLSESLTNQTVEVYDLMGDGNKVLMRYHMTAIHKNTFAGVPATGKKIEWDEIASIEFGEDGKIKSLWFMCEELKLALELGLKVIN